MRNNLYPLILTRTPQLHKTNGTQSANCGHLLEPIYLNGGPIVCKAISTLKTI